MKKLLILAVLFVGLLSARAEKSWVLIERTAGAWTNTVPDDVLVLNWSDHAMARVHLFQKYRPPTAFPAMVHVGDLDRIAYGFTTVEAGKDLLMRQALGMGPHLELQAQEMPYIVLTPTNGPGIGIAGVAPDGDLVTWIEHASPWDAGKASSNRLAAVAARTNLLADVKTLWASITNNIADEQAIPIEVSTNAVKQLRKELIDLGQDVKVLRGIFARMLKQAD